MAGWNGTGTFVRAYNWVTDKLASIKIIASRMDGEFDNYKAGLENCLTRDGQTPPTAGIDWNSQKITSLAAGTAATDAANLGQVTGVTTGNAFRRNLLINGAFDVWQAGAGGSASIAGGATRTRTADCWWAVRASSATGYTVSQQAGAFGRYALKWQRDSGNSSTANMLLAQSLETANCVRLKRGTGTAMYLSFYAKKGANYSGGNLTADVVLGTGTDENVLDGYTGASTLATVAVSTLSTSLQRFTLAVPASTSINELGVRFTWTPTGTAGADDSITIEGVQLEAASAATDFEFLPFDETLRQCQRYYEKPGFLYTTAPAQNVGNGGIFFPAIGSGAVVCGRFTVRCVQKRSSSGMVITTYNPAAANAEVYNETDGANCVGVSTGLVPSYDGFYISFTGNAGMTAGDALVVNATLADPKF